MEGHVETRPQPKWCKKCQAETDRYSSGRCRQCCLRYSSERHSRLKSESKCVRCQAGLLEDPKSIYCSECTVERSIADLRRYRKDPSAKRASTKARYWADPEKSRAYVRDLRRRAYTEGRCQSCRQPRLSGSLFCEKHREVNRDGSRARWQRRAAGKSKRRVHKKPWSVVGFKKRIPTKGRTRLEPMAVPTRDRLLRAMRFLDWSPFGDITEVLGIAYMEDDHREWDVFMQHIMRLTKQGFVERREYTTQRYEYRLTPAGLAEVDRIIRETVREAA